MKSHFEWDEKKNIENRLKHGVSFFEAQKAFLDPNRHIAKDLNHSADELRYYCFGQVHDDIMTVRFTYRSQKIRIKGRKIYENTSD